ncbi:MAG: DUF4102 domain-containing protein [Caldilineae bacterium]|nr:MAG: DUF4102 domain-containing protein [Caldilineae bacterium]
MRLTDTRIRNARPGAKPHKLFDGGGLFLLVTPKGQRWWRLKYRWQGREKLISLGVYPAVSLAEARRRRDEAKRLLARGIDPSARRRAEKEARRKRDEGSFVRVAETWLAFKAPTWAPATRRKAELVVRRHLIPALGQHSVDTLSGRDAAPVLRRLAAEAPVLAVKARQYLQAIVRHAIGEGLREEGRTLMLDGILPVAANREHIPAATLPEEAAEVMRAIRRHPQPVTRAALLMCAYTAQRPGTVVAMRWEELSADLSEWRIPGGKMKTRHAHIVPLPRQAVALLESLRPLSGGEGYVFPPLAGRRTPHLNRDSLSKALRAMGFAGRHATHGFRAMFRTLARERLGIDSDILEAQLAHAKRGEVQAAYDRTAFTEARRLAMQRWADWLDELAADQAVAVVAR